MPPSNLIFAKGDLVHIPQSAVLYGTSTTTHPSPAKIAITKKPELAIFINYKPDGMSEVVMGGQKWLVKNKELYLNKEVG